MDYLYETNEKVTLTYPSAGRIHSASFYEIDAAMDRYLPASCFDLRRIVETKTGIYYASLRSVTAFLVILAVCDRFDENA